MNLNMDIELWRKTDSYNSPSIHLTVGGGIGINCGSHVIVAPVETWHDLGEKFLCVNEHLPEWRRKLAMWLLRYNRELTSPPAVNNKRGKKL